MQHGSSVDIVGCPHEDECKNETLSHFDAFLSQDSEEHSREMRLSEGICILPKRLTHIGRAEPAEGLCVFDDVGQA